MDSVLHEQDLAIDRILRDTLEQFSGDISGAVADYIPELSKIAPNQFGIAIATADGNVHAVGDASSPFTIQSASKALTYCMAVEHAGRQTVFSHVGVEPSGDPFNAIEFNPLTRRPYNPMVNAGAITVAGLLAEALGADAAFVAVLDTLSEAAGRRLAVDDAVYRSEAETGHRNRAIGHRLRSVGAISGDVDAVLDLYFRQCAISVTARDLAVMGATIANMGENPLTGRQVLDVAAVRDAQAVMFTCGMYDYSGNWAFDVGIPAKSGVGGGIMGVVNRQFGIATFSPRLDGNGNSVRGIRAFRAISQELGLHAFDVTNPGSAFVTSFFR